MGVELAQANGLTIAYEEFGERGDPPVLLIMGIGSQMIGWPEGFCAELARRGHRVVRFDNRDAGESTHLHDAGKVDVTAVLGGDRSSARYTLSDMADDAAALLDALDIQMAHVVGASMGGMIAQTIAIEHPERVLSLCSIMSNTGDFWHGQPALTMYAVLLKPSPREREPFIEHAVEMFRTIPGAQLCVVPHAGHGVMPKETILTFLRETDTRKS